MADWSDVDFTRLMRFVRNEWRQNRVHTVRDIGKRFPTLSYQKITALLKLGEKHGVIERRYKYIAGRGEVAYYGWIDRTKPVEVKKPWYLRWWR